MDGEDDRKGCLAFVGVSRCVGIRVVDCAFISPEEIEQGEGHLFLCDDMPPFFYRSPNRTPSYSNAHLGFTPTITIDPSLNRNQIPPARVPKSLASTIGIKDSESDLSAAQLARWWYKYKDVARMRQRIITHKVRVDHLSSTEVIAAIHSWSCWLLVRRDMRAPRYVLASVVEVGPRLHHVS